MFPGTIKMWDGKKIPSLYHTEENNILSVYALPIQENVRNAFLLAHVSTISVHERYMYWGETRWLLPLSYP